jgi:hypothetical protein
VLVHERCPTAPARSNDPTGNSVRRGLASSIIRWFRWCVTIVGALSDPVEPFYAFNAPGQSIDLYDGPMKFQEQNVEGQIQLRFAPGLDLTWQVAAPRCELRREPQELGITRPHGQYTIFAGQQSFDRGWTNGASMAVDDPQLARVIAHWVNLPDLPRDPWIQLAEGWKLTVSSRPDLGDVLRAVREQSSIAITHAMEISRVDGSTFTPAEVSPLLSGLQFGLSFGAGCWLSPILPIGLDVKGNPIWEEWRNNFCTPGMWQGSGNWLNFNRDRDVRNLIECCVRAFVDKWEREHIWIPLLALAVQSNMKDLRLEQRIMGWHSGLEMVCYVVLRNDKKLTSSQYKNLGNAAEKLRETLAESKVSTQVDATSMPELDAYLQYEIAHPDPNNPGPVDGPAVTTRVRNKIVHPKPSANKTADALAHAQRQDAARFESCQLSQEYLMLILMHRLGYQGQYRAPAATVPQRSVPWV